MQARYCNVLQSAGLTSDCYSAKINFIINYNAMREKDWYMLVKSSYVKNISIKIKRTLDYRICIYIIKFYVGIKCVFMFSITYLINLKFVAIDRMKYV